MSKRQSSNGKVIVIRPPGLLHELLTRLDLCQFENLVAATFEEQGYTVHPNGKGSLVLSGDCEMKLAQCRNCKLDTVEVHHIREFLGELSNAWIENGIVIILNDFSADARALAEEHRIRLIDGAELALILEDLNWKFNPAIQVALQDEGQQGDQRKAA